MHPTLSTGLLLSVATGGCCLSEAKVQAIEARVDADNATSLSEAMAKALVSSHVTQVSPRVVSFVWHTPLVPETATDWIEIPVGRRPAASDAVLLKPDQGADLQTTWGALTGGPFIDARTPEGAPVLLVLTGAGVRFGQGADGRPIRFVQSPRWTDRHVHSCGSCGSEFSDGAGMPNPSQPIKRAVAFYVFDGRTSSELRTVEVPFAATQLHIRCDHSPSG
jgi:hypothetical protein